MSLAQRVLLNTAVQVAGKAALFVAALVTVRLTTDYLGLDGFGDYAVVLAFAPILLAFGDLGLGTLLARELARTPERRDELGGTLLALRLGASALIVVLTAAAAPFLPYDGHVRVGLVIAAVGTLALASRSLVISFFQVALRLDLVALIDLITAALTVSLVGAVVAFDLGFYALVAATAAAAAVNVGLALLLSRRFWRPNLRFRRELVPPLLRQCMPLALVVIFGLVHFKVDAVLLSLLRDPEELAVYTVAAKFLEGSVAVSALFMAPVFPILAGALARDEERAQEVVEKAFTFLLLLAVPFALGLALLAEPLVGLVAPADFATAVGPLRLLAPAVVFLFADAVLAAVLVALDRQRSIVAVALAGIVLNVALNLLLIPPYGVTGAAVATVVSEAAGFAALAALVRRAYPFSFSLTVGRRDLALLLGR